MPTSVPVGATPQSWRPSHLRRGGEYQQSRRTYGDAANDPTVTLPERWLRVNAVHHIATRATPTPALLPHAARVVEPSGGRPQGPRASDSSASEAARMDTALMS